MIFGQSWILWALFAAMIPVLVHLINHWRHKSIEWGAMAFLFSATKQIKGRKKIVHYLILFLRMLILALLIFALARPKLGDTFSFGSRVPDQVIVLVDRSLSMEHRNATSLLSHRDILLGRIRETMKALPETKFYILESAGAKLWEVKGNDLLSEVSDLSASETVAEIPQMLAKSLQYMEDNFSGVSEIWIASDLQASNWNLDSELWTGFNQWDREQTGLNAIRLLNDQREYAHDDSLRIISAQLRDKEIVLTMEVLQKGKDDALGKRTLPIQISINGGRLTESVLLQGKSTRFTKVISLPAPLEEGYGYVALPPDENVLDNSSFFTFKKEMPLKIGVFGEEGESLDTWKKILAPKALTSRTMNVLKRSDLLKSSLASYGLILWQGALPNNEEGKVLEEYVQRGGLLLFAPSPEVVDSPESFLGYTWGKMDESLEEEVFSLTEWNKSDDLLQDDAEGVSIPLHQVQAIKRMMIEGDGFSLVKWNDGTSAISRKIVGDGEVYFLNTLPDYTWSNLGDGALLIPMIQRLCQKARLRFDPANSVDIHSEINRQSLSKPRVRVDDFPSEKMLKQPEFSTGIYRVDNDLLAVNRPNKEDLTEEISMDELKTKLTSIPLYTFMDGNIREDSQDSTLVREVWRWFIILGILCLLLETWLTLPRPVPSQSRKKEF